ncbi:MAG: M56 family metallopeptidase [Bacteroidota bacterium]
MLLYLLKSTACLTLFFLFYKGLLENAQMHQFKRFYLLGSLILSFVIPSLVFIEYVDMPFFETVQTSISSSEANTAILTSSESVSDWDMINFSLLGWSIYGLGVLLLSIRFIKNLIDIIQRIQKNQKIKVASHIKVLIQEKIPPHTFLKYIFLEREKFHSNTIAPEVLLHEETHAIQKHSYDILFVEVLQILLWFNPLVYLYKHGIKLNHEFLADDAVLRKLNSPKTYQNTLLSYLSAASESKYQSITMASAIHYSSIKKRFTVMKKQTSKKAKLIRMLLILPMVSILLWSFSETKYIPRPSNLPLNSIDDIQQEGIHIEINEGQITVNGIKAALKDFAQTLNTMTKDWEETDYTAYRPNIQIRNTSKAQLLKIDKEFKKTHLSKANGGMSIIPPKPPVPPAPPKPIQSSKNISDHQYASNKIDSIVNSQDPIDSPNALASGAFFSSPPPPPTPVSPLDHVIEMAKKGADFYYENRKISSDEAIDLLKRRKNLSIETKSQDSSKPQVRITKSPITSTPSNTTGATGIGIETGTKKANGQQLFYSTSEGRTHYFNKSGESVDATGQPLAEKGQKGPLFYLNGKKIPADEANKLLSNNTSLQVTHGKNENGHPTIILTDLLAFNAPNPNNTGGSDPFVNISDAIAQNASFYFNNNPISSKRAYELTQTNNIKKVQVKRKKGKVQKVFFWDKN